MESRGPEDSKNVKSSQANFFEGFISFFEDFSLTTPLGQKAPLLHYLTLRQNNMPSLRQ